MANKYFVIGNRTGGPDAPICDGASVLICNDAGRPFSEQQATEVACQLNGQFPDGTFLEVEVERLAVFLARSDKRSK